MEQKLKIRLSQLLSSLSFALDIAENRYFNHSRRTAYVAYYMAKEMGLSDEDIINTYFSSLIHDIGMAGHLAKYSIVDIHTNFELKKEHCSYGYEIIKDLPIDKQIKEYVLYHHEQWNGTGPFNLKADEIPLISQIIHMADFFEVYYLRLVEDKGNIEEFSRVDVVEKWISPYRNVYFKDEVCDSFLTLVKKEKFWFDLTSKNIEKALEIIKPDKEIYVDVDGLHEISRAFSKLIDYKSEFTYKHTKGISIITNEFAKYLGYNPLMVKKLTIAADLHDIGKLVVPLSILEKPGKLSPHEFQIIKAHPYYTKLILKQIKGIEDIAEWAGNHHEKLNGSGYPEKLTERYISKEDQIIAIADIFQALTEDRPYRKGMDSQTAIDIMMDMAHRGELSKNMINDFKHFITYSEVLI